MVAALGCFLIAVAAGLVSDNLKEPRKKPEKAPEIERQRNGWGEPSEFVGQYELKFLKPVGPNRSNSYTEFASEGFTEGHLTLFMREVYEHRPHTPGGVLTLRGPEENLVIYLSELSSSGRVLYATVKGGTYEGPQIGSFGGVRRGNTIYGGLKLRGLANVEADFVRYTKDPNATAGVGEGTHLGKESGPEEQALGE